MKRSAEDYQKFLDAFLTLTAPYLKLKYNKEDRTLSYLYVNAEKRLMKLIPITDNFEEILYFFDLHWIEDLNETKEEDFINAILYSTFFNYEVIGWKQLKDLGVPTSLIINYKKARRDDSLMCYDSENYLFIDNHHISIGMVDRVFPKLKLKQKIKDLLKEDSVRVEDKLINYPNVIVWCPRLKEEKSVEAIVGICQAHAAYIKDTYKKSHKKYIKETDLDTIVKNFRNYIYDVKFIT